MKFFSSFKSISGNLNLPLFLDLDYVYNCCLILYENTILINSHYNIISTVYDHSAREK